MTKLDVSLSSSAAAGGTAPQRAPGARAGGTGEEESGAAGAAGFAALLAGDAGAAAPAPAPDAEPGTAQALGEVEIGAGGPGSAPAGADEEAAAESAFAALLAQAPVVVPQRAPGAMLATADVPEDAEGKVAAGGGDLPTALSADAARALTLDPVDDPVDLPVELAGTLTGDPATDGSPLPLSGTKLPVSGAAAPAMPIATTAVGNPGAHGVVERGDVGPGSTNTGAVPTGPKVDADLPRALLPPAGRRLDGDSSAVAALPGAMAAGVQGAQRTPAALLAALPLPAPGVPGYEQAFGQRLIWMANHGIQDAMVRVHPDQLGPVDIHLRVDGDSAELALASSHPAAREALESALPRLRDQLGEAGYQLVRAEVTGQHSREGGARDGSPAAGEAQENRAQESEPEATLPVLDRRIAGRAGMLDLFA